MRKIVSVLSAAVLTLTLCACSSGSSTSSITVAGSTTCLPIAEIEMCIRDSGITVVDDYGHHPTEIKATLAAASSLGYKHVDVVFQPCLLYT